MAECASFGQSSLGSNDGGTVEGCIPEQAPSRAHPGRLRGHPCYAGGIVGAAGTCTTPTNRQKGASSSEVRRICRFKQSLVKLSLSRGWERAGPCCPDCRGSPQSPPKFRKNRRFARASTCVCNARWSQPSRLLTEGL